MWWSCKPGSALVPTVLTVLTFLTALTVLTVPLAAQEIVSREAYRLPPFDSLTARQQRDIGRRSSRGEYDSTRSDARYRLEKVRYRSDGLAVVAYLYSPVPGSTSALRPLVVYNRGSFVEGDLAPSLAPIFRRYAAAGYTVLAPQYRGSDGGEGRDELGGADVADVVHAVALGRALQGVDSGRVYMFGESRGGMMTYQAIRARVPISAAAVVGAFTDVEETMRSDPGARNAAPQIWPDIAERRAEIVERRSAIGWAEALDRPLLILHGGADPQISPEQSLRLASRLQALGRTYELHIVAGGDHVLGGLGASRETAIVAWFRRQE